MPLQRINIGRIQRFAHFDDSGHHLIAVLTADQDTILLKVISIDYEVGKALSIRELLSSVPPSHYLGGPLFVVPSLVGLLCDVADERYSVHIINYTQEFSVDVPIATDLDNEFVSFSVVDRRLFIISTSYYVVERDETYDIYCCPIDKLTSGENLSRTEIAMEISANIVHAAQLVAHEIVRGFDDETVQSTLSPLGFHTLHVVYPEPHVSAGIISASFWPIEEIHACDKQGVKYETIEIEGKVTSHGRGYSAPWLVASSRSGIYSVLVVGQDTDEAPELCLLQWDSTPPTIHVRTLEVPRYIDLTDVYAVAIEERYGVIYLSHAQGYLFALPYA
ncbi:hypothetical protein C0995_012869 [Termitomyces sp. Mi166|nr:hypothetical protein C0995_012869 [Termitomyces sp. Mi166\